MGLFDDFKAHVLKQDTQPVDPDAAYTTHRTAADFSLSPAGQVLREVAIPKDETIKLEAQIPGAPEPKPDTNDPNRRTEDEFRAMGLSYDQITPEQIQAASAQQEANRQGMLKASMDKAPAQPPVGLEAVTRMIDFPASKVRDAIAKKVSEATGANVTGDNLAEYVGKETAPGDPVGQLVNSTLTSILTDPLVALPGLGIPSSAYKKGIEGVIKGIEKAGELSKGAGVDLVAERGSVSLGGSGAIPPVPPVTPIDPATKYQQLVEVQRRAKKGETFSDKQVVTEAKKLIDSSKLSAATIEQLAPGTALNAESQFAVHALAAENFIQIQQLAQTAATPVEKKAVLDAFWEHGQIFDAPRRGAIAETGRAERILGTAAPADMAAKKAFLDQFAPVAGKLQGGVSLERAVELIKNIKTEDQLAILAKNATKPQLKDAFLGLWVNSLLSGPQTHVANILGNSATLAWGVAERQLAGLMLGEVHPGEASAMVKGVFESFGDALQLGARAFMTNESKFGSTKLEQTKAVSFEEAGMAGVPGQALDYLSAFFQGFGGRPLLAADEFFKAINFRAEVRALALREAHAAVSSEQLTGKAARDRVKELSEKYAADVPEHIHADAEQYAAYMTFTKELGPGGKWLQEGAATVPAVKLITPFIRTPINIFKYAGERTPFALFTKSMWADIQAGGARRQLALAKVSTGAMVAGTGVLWAANGFITGGGPNPKKFNLDVMREGGWQPYSVNVSAIKRSAKGGSSEWQAGDKLIAYNRVEPLGMLLGMYANYVDIASNAETDSDYEELAMKMTMATVKTMSSKTFIKGLSQTALAFAYPEEFMGETLERQAVSFVPILGSSLSRGVARQIDPVVREADGFIEELMKNTPILSKDLPPTLDIIHGEPVYREGGVGPDIASPLYQSTYKKDPVIEEIVRNQVNISRPNGIVHGVELNQEGKNELQRIITHAVKKGGRNLHASLEHMMNSAVYKNGTTGPDGRRALLIKSLMHAFTEKGQMLLLKKHPEIRQQVKDNQRAHADKMKSVRPVPSDDEINNADVDLDVGGF